MSTGFVVSIDSRYPGACAGERSVWRGCVDVGACRGAQHSVHGECLACCEMTKGCSLPLPLPLLMSDCVTTEEMCMVVFLQAQSLYPPRTVPVSAEKCVQVSGATLQHCLMLRLCVWQHVVVVNRGKLSVAENLPPSLGKLSLGVGHPKVSC